MNELQINEAVVLALQALLESLKALNNQTLILTKLERLLMNDQEAQTKLNAIIASQSAQAAAVADVANDLAEASVEITTKLADLQATIDSLLANATGLSPELQALIDTAAAQAASFNDSLVQVQAASQGLADIVPNAPAEPVV